VSDYKIVKEEVVEKSLFGLIKTNIIYYKVLNNNGVQVYISTSEELAKTRLDAIIECKNAPLYKIEKNMNNKYRIMTKYIYSDSSYNYIEFLNGKFFASIEEAEKCIEDHVKSTVWKTVKEFN